MRTVRKIVKTYSVPAGGTISDTVVVQDFEVSQIQIQNAGANTTATIDVEGITGSVVDIVATFGYPATCIINVSATNAGTATETFDLVIYGTYVSRK